MVDDEEVFGERKGDTTGDNDRKNQDEYCRSYIPL